MTSKDELREKLKGIMNTPHITFHGTMGQSCDECIDSILNLLEGEKQQAYREGCRHTELKYKPNYSKPQEPINATLNKEPNKGEDV